MKIESDSAGYNKRFALVPTCVGYDKDTDKSVTVWLEWYESRRSFHCRQRRLLGGSDRFAPVSIVED